MTALERGLLLIKEHEGGEFTEDPDDPGGATRWGISLRFLQSIDPEARRSDVVAMTWDRAGHIYTSEFWKLFGYEFLPDPVAVKVFDLSVLVGPKQVGLCLQRACRSSGRRVEEDGIVGHETRTACHSVPSEVLLAALRSEAAGFFRLLAERKPPLGKFLDGWLDNRAYS